MIDYTLDMSTDPDKATGCPIESDKSVNTKLEECGDNSSVIGDEWKEKQKVPRSVRFPDEDLIVTQYFEPANPWHDGKRKLFFHRLLEKQRTMVLLYIPTFILCSI